MTAAQTRTVPIDVEAEEACIASVLTDGDNAASLLPMLRPNAFTSDRVEIWRACEKVWGRSEDVNVITVAYEMTKKEAAFSDGTVLDAIGGQAALNGIIRRCPTTIGAEFYANIVRECAHRRWIISKASALADAAYAGGEPVEDMLSRFTDEFVRNGVERTNATVRHIGDVVIDALPEFERWRKNPKQLRGHLTGWHELDLYLNGLVAGCVTMILADTGIGKSFTLANILCTLAACNVPCLFFGTEMTDVQSVWRMAFMEAGVNDVIARIRGYVTEQEAAAVGSAFGSIRSWPMWIADSRIKLPSLVSHIRRAAAVHNLTKYGGIIAIDHIDDVSVPGTSNGVERVEEVMRVVKDLALSLNVHVLFVSHTNREGQREGVKLHTTYGGSEKEKRSDNALILAPVRKVGNEWQTIPRDLAAEDRRKGLLHLRCEIAKSRYGYEGSVILRQDWRKGGRINPVEDSGD